MAAGVDSTQNLLFFSSSHANLGPGTDCCQTPANQNAVVFPQHKPQSSVTSFEIFKIKIQSYFLFPPSPSPPEMVHIPIT